MIRADLRCLALAAALPALLAACGRRDWRVVQLYGGEASAWVLERPTRVEAFRIACDPAPPPDAVGAGGDRIGPFPVLSGPVELAPDAAAELTGILLDPATYDWRHAKRTPIRPTVGLRLVRDVSRLDLALSFPDHQLLVYRYGRLVGVEDFDTAGPRLAALLRDLAPR